VIQWIEKALPADKQSERERVCAKLRLCKVVDLIAAAQFLQGLFGAPELATDWIFTLAKERGWRNSKDLG
jgi:hypothetical protein